MHASTESVLPRWTENGTIVRPGTFPRGPRDPTFVEFDEETLKRRWLLARIVTPESGIVEQTQIARVLSEYRAKQRWHERKLRIAPVLVAAAIGAACGVLAGLSGRGHAAREERARGPREVKELALPDVGDALRPLVPSEHHRLRTRKAAPER